MMVRTADRGRQPFRGALSPRGTNREDSSRRFSYELEPSADNLVIKSSRVFQALAVSLRRDQDQVEGQKGFPARHAPPRPPNAHLVFEHAFVQVFHHEQIDVAVLAGPAVSIGAEQDHLLWLELLDQHPGGGEAWIGG